MSTLNSISIFICIYFSVLACKCNSQGTVSDRNVLFIFQKNNNACNNNSCTCLLGYQGNDCNTCIDGYIVTSSNDGENVCEPGENA